MSKKRTLDSFFKPFSQHHVVLPPSVGQPCGSRDIAKRQRVELSSDHVHLQGPSAEDLRSFHPTYPFPIPHLPSSIVAGLGAQIDLVTGNSTGVPASPANPGPSSPISINCPASMGRPINNQPYLDLVYYDPFLSRGTANALFAFLRASLPFYRVRYRIQRGGIDTQVDTPRYTSVFGIDDSSSFDALSGFVIERESGEPVAREWYKCHPRPMPDCLDRLRTAVERETGERFNFCLVNYYAGGDDSISYHSDDERFLGKDPAIASLSLGVTRDFCMKRKALPNRSVEGDAKSKRVAEKSLRLSLRSGDMVLMRGATQANWLHSVPKRKGGEWEKGRINLTFRRAMVKGGTENYYRYNVGDGPVYRWDEGSGDMVVWKPVNR